MRAPVLAPLFALLASAATWPRGDAAPVAGGEAGPLASSRLSRFVAAVKADRFDVTEGSMYLPDFRELACYGISPSCNGNNATNPYLLVSVPTPGRGTVPGFPPLDFQMRQDEAIVLIGRTPPPAAYFSFRSFVIGRWMEREGVHRKFLPSLGDTNNMLTFNTQGRSRGDSFGRDFVLMIVSDRGTEGRVRRALRGSGFPDAIVNRDVISPNIARMSSKENGDFDMERDDDFVAVMRVALFDRGHEAEGAAYLANPPITVLRLTPNPRTGRARYAPIPLDRLRPRGTGQTELDLTPDVEALKKAILARYPAMKAEDMRPTTWLEESFVAMQKDLDVLGESRDTVYLRNEGTFRLADDEFLVVYGVNHEATGKATYANFAIYDTCKTCPYAGESSRRFAGSAGDYLSGTRAPASVNLLYAWKVARHCGSDPHCTEVPTGECMEGIAPDAEMFAGFRAYVEPATAIGPAFVELYYDRVLKFTPEGPSLSDVTVSPREATDIYTGVPPGTPVTISFRPVSGSGSPTIAWRAVLKGDDGCAVVVPDAGTWDGEGDVTVSVVVPPTQRTVLTLFLDAQDDRGRRAPTRGLTLLYW